MQMIQKKFSTFDGVIIPTLEAIIGAVLFLILPGLIGKVGLFYMLLIILISNMISIATTLSITNCITNLVTLGTGGIYPLIRKSLGLAFGGSVGIQLYLAQAATIAFTTIGFAESIHVFLNGIPNIHNLWGFQLINNQTVLSLTIFFIFIILALIGSDFTVKIQKGIIVTLFFAISGIVISSFISQPVFNEQNKTVAVFLAGNNFYSSLPVSFPMIILAFASFFPALKGITVGISMSGELKNPKKNIISGTFLSLLIGFIIYVVISFVYARINPELLINYPLIEILGIYKFSFISLLVFIGILLGTFSATLSYFMSAPRILSAIVDDKIFPEKLDFIKNDFLPDAKEPRIAIIITAVFALPLIIFGELTLVAAFVGIAYLAVYSWINFSAFLENASKNPSFRPTTRIHWTISLFGFIICNIAIFLFNPIIGFVILIFQISIFILLLKFKSSQKLEGVWWGVIFSLITVMSKRLSLIEQGKKNWRPVVKVFAFADDEKNSYNIIHLGEMIADYLGAVSADIFYSIKNKLIANINTYNINVNAISLENKIDLTSAILVAANSSNYIKIKTNTVLAEYNKSVNWKIFIDEIISGNKNLLIYKDGLVKDTNDVFKVDVWWKENDNGLLSLLIAHIIFVSNLSRKIKTRIRIIHKAAENEDLILIKNSLKKLISKARIDAEMLLIDNDSISIDENVKIHSDDSDLILIGLTDVYKDKNIIETILTLNKDDLNEKINKFTLIPPLLFVKAAYNLNLIEE